MGYGGFLKKKLERFGGHSSAHPSRADPQKIGPNRAKASHQKTYKNDTQKFTVVRKKFRFQSGLKTFSQLQPLLLRPAQAPILPAKSFS